MSLLEINDVTVRFGGLVAVDGATINVDERSVTGLIGPNGAGKTTLFNVITGLQAPAMGRVELAGRDVTRKRPHQRARLGIGRTFQRLEAFGSLTARENVLVALEMRRRWAKESYDPGTVADELLERVGLTHIAGTRVRLLSLGPARPIPRCCCSTSRHPDSMKVRRTPSARSCWSWRPTVSPSCSSSTTCPS